MFHSSAYNHLKQHFTQISKYTLADLFSFNKERHNQFTLTVNNLSLNFASNNITQETLKLLVDLAHAAQLDQHIAALFNGDRINNTENRPVLHTALRSNVDELMLDGKNIMLEIKQVLRQMEEFSNKVHNGLHLGYSGKVITDIVNIGIGGSDLGPQLVCQALKPYRKNKLNVHFISSVDGYQVYDVLADLNPETTLFVIASKTFTTEETLTNANTVRNWLLNKSNNHPDAIEKHFVAVSTNNKAVKEFGINLDNMFVFWDFVGGRYSLWSAIGLSIVLYIGFDHFSQLLAGANAMDEHFRGTQDLLQNMPVIMALLSIWYVNFYGYTTQIISPYNTRLSKLPSYLQQLMMESNGKSVTKSGEKVNYKTCPVIWGDSGINGQHAYYQLLHQGTSIYTMDIILALSEKFSDSKHNAILQANAYAQAQAFMQGKSYNEAKEQLLKQGIAEVQASFLAKHKVYPGNRPTNMLLLPEISPYYLGNLIALYEHKTFVEGVIWDINSFDQYGVELGKELAKSFLAKGI